MAATMRTAEITRNTKETQIRVRVNLDGSGGAKLSTGLPFLEHMLDQVARHGMLDLEIDAKGDLHIDAHHTVEDTGITLGQAFARAIGDKAGVRRYGHAYVPLDEAISRAVIDLSGRPGLEYHVKYVRGLIGEFDVDLVREFFQGFVNHALVTLHIDNLRGDNAHHQCETIFKAFGRALRMAAEPDPRAAGTIPSTKGSLERTTLHCNAEKACVATRNFQNKRHENRGRRLRHGQPAFGVEGARARRARGVRRGHRPAGRSARGRSRRGARAGRDA
jgi:imidazoleglycerol-phosphate dehydratase